MIAVAEATVHVISCDQTGDLALVLSGGGARAAYQVGFLRYLARAHPDLRPRILTGVSAGALNAVFLAASPKPFPEAVRDLSDLWGGLSIERVFDVDALRLARNVAGWGLRLLSGGARGAPRVRGLVDARPLARLVREALDPEGRGLTAVRERIESGELKALAVTATSYATGQTITFVQCADCGAWERSNRKAVLDDLRVEHVLASAALPFFFPAVAIDGTWYGDGGVRLAAPLSPALHLGAQRILAISARHLRTREEENRPDSDGYPPPARVGGLLMNAVFLDLFDQDVERMRRINELLQWLPEERRQGMRCVDHVLVRPSDDLGKLANRYEVELPRAFRWLVRGLGTKELRSNDLLSLVLFEGQYLRGLMDLGEADAERQAEAIAELVR
jgi:NTE family protein